jgi:undecaprenyl-diphosphatase
LPAGRRRLVFVSSRDGNHGGCSTAQVAERVRIPLFVDLLVALAGLVAAVLAAEWYKRSSITPERPALESARVVGEAVRQHTTLRGLLVRRLDRGVASGFLLTLALGFALAAGVLLGILVYLVRSVHAVQHVDNFAANWAFAHRTSFSTRGLHAITQLGSIRIVVILAIVVAAVDYYRTRSRWSLPFLLAVLAGMELLSITVKDIVGRVRPVLDPAAASLGPSFPSGHSATSAAFYAAAALILGRRLPWRQRQFLIGLAVAIAAAVAASRVLLDVHWLSDVIGGLSLGWGWFALCAAVFGGRLLRPTAAVDVAATEAAVPESAGRRSRREPIEARARTR